MIPNNPPFSKLEPYLVPIIVILVGAGAFGLGRLSTGGEAPLRVIYPEAAAAKPLTSMAAIAEARAGENVPSSAAVSQGAFIASKNGAKYYLATCSGASRIKQENRVYFVSKEAAEAAGYEPAANCAGLLESPKVAP